MKKHILLFNIALLAVTFSLKAQTTRLGFSVEATIDTVARYELKGIGNHKIAIQMPFGRYTILNPMVEKALAEGNIHSIDLVYTDYPRGADLERLNKRRVAALYMLNPDIFDRTDIRWRLVVQNGFKTVQQANKLFHGFVITMQPPASARPISAAVTKEKEALKEIVAGKKELKDSTVMNVLERHTWKKMLIVGDLTGSMSPYVGQLLLWVKLNLAKNNVKQFVFFNDGDSKLDDKKVIGETGGIYSIRADSLETVIQTALRTMEGGSGGDSPENNIEALLKGIQLCPDCEEVVMIADNWARVRDMELLPKVKRPVKIIVCGKGFGVNPDYLNIARATKGSIHTMQEDLFDLMKISEGEILKIGEHAFQVREGKFVPLY